MNLAHTRRYRWLATAVIASALLITPQRVLAHCDTLDGPVVIDARSALASGEVTPVLKWVKAADEQAIRDAFTRTLAVRQLDPQAQALADSYFFETLVRIHRAGEGAPYTGLKGAGQIEPVVAKADQALAQGSVDTLVKAIVAHTEEGIHARFNHALEARRHVAESVAAGREYVAAYVDYVHYVEGIAQVVHGAPHHGEAPAKAPAPAGHHH
jgi:hypothetical protein